MPPVITHFAGERCRYATNPDEQKLPATPAKEAEIDQNHCWRLKDYYSVHRPKRAAEPGRLGRIPAESGSGSGPAPMSDLIIADLNRRKLDLVCEIERLRRQYCVTSLH